MAELTLQELRIRGGQSTMRKYGREHFAELGRKGAEKKKQLKNEAKLGA